MKKIYLLLTAITILTFSNCSPKKVYGKIPYSISEVVSHPTQGAVRLRGVGDEVKSKAGSGNGKALKSAHKKAIQQLFYLGYVGTDFKNPMIRQGQSVEDKNKAFFDKFWDTGYERFITENQVEYYSCAVEKECVQAVSTFTLNYNMLRKELENNKIINKIGF